MDAEGDGTSRCVPQTEQDSLSLNSYVVASSVGNISIKDLKDPVKIQISHLNGKVVLFSPPQTDVRV